MATTMNAFAKTARAFPPLGTIARGDRKPPVDGILIAESFTKFMICLCREPLSTIDCGLGESSDFLIRRALMSYEYGFQARP